MVIRKNNQSLEWLEFELFSEFRLRHAVFLRHGGVSSPPFDSLNFGSSCGDLEKNIRKNFETASGALQIQHLATAFQVHGAQVKKAAQGCQIDCDGLVTGEAGLGLFIQHADCQAAIFYDPIQHAVANIHCGWRGNVKNIFKRAVEILQFSYGCKPENLFVAISPSLGPNASEFRNFMEELPEEFLEFQIKPIYFDFWSISEHQLRALGIPRHHIQIAKICTYSNPQDCFSYRRQKISGRHGTFVVLE